MRISPKLKARHHYIHSSDCLLYVWMGIGVAVSSVEGGAGVKVRPPLQKQKDRKQERLLRQNRNHHLCVASNNPLHRVFFWQVAYLLYLYDVRTRWGKG